MRDRRPVGWRLEDTVGRIPWTRWDGANEAIVAGYLKLAALQARLAVVADSWAELAPPRRTPTPISKTGGAKTEGPNPHLLGKMLAGGQNFRRRAGWRGRVVVGRAAGWAADRLAPVVGR